MDRPTAATVRAGSQVDWASLGFPAPTPPAADPLTPLVEAANVYVEQMTCRIPLETAMPNELAALAIQVVRMRTEQFILQMQAGYVESASDDLTQSFSAGSYSETRRTGSSGGSSYRDLNTNPAIKELLYLLMSDECLAKWEAIARGEFPPAWGVTEEWWSDWMPDYWPYTY